MDCCKPDLNMCQCHEMLIDLGGLYEHESSLTAPIFICEQRDHRSSATINKRKICNNSTWWHYRKTYPPKS